MSTLDLAALAEDVDVLSRSGWEDTPEDAERVLKILRAIPALITTARERDQLASRLGAVEDMAERAERKCYDLDPHDVLAAAGITS